MTVRIGTRGSKLALAQTEIVANKLKGLGIEVEQKTVSTQGDEVTNVPLHEIGKQGVFVKALDDAILNKEIDCAVHSMKDIPAIRPSGLVIRRDPSPRFTCRLPCVLRPRLFGKDRRDIEHAQESPAPPPRSGSGDPRPAGERGYADEEAPRRPVQCNRARRSRPPAPRPPDPGRAPAPGKFVPTPNQGTIAVVSRADPSLMEVLSALDHPGTRKDVAIERAVMEQVGAGCFTPMGIYCKAGHLTAEVLSLDGKRIERIEQDVATIEEARAIGKDLREKAGSLIEEAYRKLGISL